MTQPPQPPQPYATPTELATYMQTEFDDAETASAQMQLGFVALLIRHEYAGIDVRTPPIDPQLPKLVSLELVSRKMVETRTGGASEVTETMDETSVTHRYGGSSRASRPFGGLELDSWARGLLDPPTESARPRAFGVRMSSYGRNRTSA
ncbi:hypothetical protein [Mycolicibacterium wolinskyi]|uniref:hypothetical protein n=1 Tax=Mycolicibacterium wolinskyi TaxID=59750 RepID=UPI0039177B2C